MWCRGHSSRLSMHPGFALYRAGVLHPVLQCTPANASPRSRACIPSKLYTLDPASEYSPIRCVRPARSGLAMMYAATDQLSSSARKMRSQKLSCQSRTSRRRRASSAAQCFHSTKMSSTDSVRACASSRTWAWSGIKQYARTSMRRVEAVVKSCDAMNDSPERQVVEMRCAVGGTRRKETADRPTIVLRGQTGWAMRHTVGPANSNPVSGPGYIGGRGE